MKLLLTSQGFSNDSIVNALKDMLVKPLEDSVITIIVTASLYDKNDKRWLLKILQKVSDLNFKFIDVLDISAVSKDKWLPRLEASDVIFLTGGVALHLLRQVRESGLIDHLEELLKTRVYVGNSAGSTITTPDISSGNPRVIEEYIKETGYSDLKGLSYVNFYIHPHYEEPNREYRQEKAVRAFAQKTDKVVYGIDNNSAVKVDGNTVEVISEGDYIILNEK